MTTPVDEVRLYELALEDGRSASPFVWRIRYALAHKGIAFQTVYLGFTEIQSVFGGKFKTVPILEHGGTVLGESWDIAEYLDRAFPGHPRLACAAAHTPSNISFPRGQRADLRRLHRAGSVLLGGECGYAADVGARGRIARLARSGLQFIRRSRTRSRH